MITVSISSYNQQEYLPDAIESAIAQTTPCEVIVIDDGSSDDSLAIAKRYPVKIVSQVNKGLPSARNTGIMNATGDYIIFLDADDILMENCVEKVTKEIKNSPVDIICWNFKSFGITNDEVKLETPTFEGMKTGNRMAYCSAFKKSTLLEVGGYSPRMLWGYEDYHLGLDLLRRGKTVVHIPEMLFLYRTKKNSMIHGARAHHEELMSQIKKDHGI